MAQASVVRRRVPYARDGSVRAGSHIAAKANAVAPATQQIRKKAAAAMIPDRFSILSPALQFAEVYVRGKSFNATMVQYANRLPGGIVLEWIRVLEEFHDGMSRVFVKAWNLKGLDCCPRSSIEHPGQRTEEARLSIQSHEFDAFRDVFVFCDVWCEWWKI